MRAPGAGGLLLVVLALAASCREHAEVRLAFRKTASGGLRGFECRERYGASPYLAARASAGQASLVVDLVRLDGHADCRPAALTDWCAVHPCSPIPGARRCIPLALDATRPDLTSALGAALRGLAGTEISREPPAEEVLVRATAVAQPCDRAIARSDFDCPVLMGCAYSCPLRLDLASGEVGLDLDASDAFCEPAVYTCASPTLSRTYSGAAQRVERLVLVDADRDASIAAFDPLKPGAVIDLAMLPTRRLNIRADTSPATVGSVRFDLDGKSRVELFAPYALAEDLDGDYQPWTPGLGKHVLKAVPFSGNEASCAEGVAAEITFEVVDTKR